MKSILLVGLGRFGRHMAMEFYRQKHEVMAVDLDEERVNDVLPYVTNAQIGDCTNEHFVASLGVRNFDLCVVAIGDNFQSSLETTALLKDYGAKFVLARASRDVHAKFLLRNGADEVIYLEKEMAIRAATTYSNDRLFDFIQLAPDYCLCEVAMPKRWIGKTVVDLEVRTRFRVSVMGVKKDEELDLMPGSTHILQADERILLLGRNEDLQQFL